MYANGPPITPDAPRRKDSALGQLLCIGCTIFVLFLVAATIVLALIPLYLPKKTVTPSEYSQYYYATGDYSGSLGNDGPLSPAARQNITRAMEDKLGLPPDSVDMDSASVASTSSERKRRGYDVARFRRYRPSRRLQRLYMSFRLRRRRCFECSLHFRIFSISYTFEIDGMVFTLVITINIRVIGFTMPPTLPPLTSTIQTNTTTTTYFNMSYTTNVIG
ncbi:unnamed protein product [Rotaria sordida]|uniref:Uncharacterized protein n=1 Tax=Rotaria sordida TaxID=392033 RepID=A0A818XV59_9BILA|nr:unnamed protein product [Rotaria sordida]CAF3744127.1 unnamed protein product [Rotaria sordida]